MLVCLPELLKPLEPHVDAAFGAVQALVLGVVFYVAASTSGAPGGDGEAAGGAAAGEVASGMCRRRVTDVEATDFSA